MAAVTRLGLDGAIAEPYPFEVGTQPNAFSFPSVQGVALGVVGVESVQVTMTGVGGAPVAVTVSGDTGYGYSKNGGAYVTGATTASNGDTFKVRVDSAATNNTGTAVTLIVGDITATFLVTTVRSAPALEGQNVLRMRRVGGRR